MTRPSGALSVGCMLCLVSLLVLPHQLPAADQADFDFGPLISRDTTMTGERRVRAFGPIYEAWVGEGGQSFVALRPFFSRIEVPSRNASRSEFLWPLGMTKVVGQQRTSWFANLFETDFDVDDPTSRHRLWIVPLFAKGRAATGEDYMGLFPLAGDVREVLTLDRTRFMLFPLYSRNKRAGVESHNIMWPFIAWRSGEGQSMFRVFPLFGRSVSEGKSEKTFMLWPFMTHARFHTKPRGQGFVVFPLFGRIVSDQERTTLILPPFVRWTRSPDRAEVLLPWPFVRITVGKVNRFYLWPILGAKSEEGLRSSFFLWPIISAMHREMPNERLTRWGIMPVLQSETRLTRVAEEEATSLPADEWEVSARKLNVWPLFAYRRDGDVNRFRSPSLWPVSEIASVENNYAPLWTLYSRTRIGDKVHNEALWGLVRHKRDTTESSISIFPLVSVERSLEDEGAVEWALFKGLLGYRSDSSGRRIRLFFMPFKDRSRATDEANETGSSVE